MANHAYAKTGKTLDAKEVDGHIRKIVSEKLNNAFIVDFNEEETIWMINYKKSDYIGFQMWISDDVEYGEMKGKEFVEYDKPKTISTNSVLEFRHGHTFFFMWWVEGVIRENLGKIYSASMFDDGTDINPTPNPEKYKTFEHYCRKDKASKKEIKTIKNHYLPSWQKVPKELIEKLSLDFKI